MKKQMPKLTLNRETLRDLDKKDLGNALGGAINVKSLVTWCDPGASC
jgi:hypothetical protein